MKRIITWILTLFVITTTCFAFPNKPPTKTGAAGAPDNGETCISCHGSSGNGSLVVSNLPNQYKSGEKYTLSVKLSQSGRQRWGFILTALDKNGNQAGTFESNDANTQVFSASGRQYIGHTSSGTAAGQSNSNTWLMDWIAPAVDTGKISFYASGNAANNNGKNTGDNGYKTEITIEAEEVGVNIPDPNLSVWGDPSKSILEAESVGNIKAPMVVGEDDFARLGKYVWLPGDAVEDNPIGDGYVEFKVHIPEAGSYTLWGRVFNMDEYSDSFWVTWQPVDSNENPQKTSNKAYRWHTAPGQLDHLYGRWIWVQVNSWLVDLTPKARAWTFDKAGETTLRIWAREDGARLDALYITNDLSIHIVNIPDPNLRAALEQALGKNEGDAITKEDLEGLKELDAEGLSITNISVLKYTTHLTQLNLAGNQITDITPIIENTGISGEINLKNNPLNNTFWHVIFNFYSSSF